MCSDCQNVNYLLFPKKAFSTALSPQPLGVTTTTKSSAPGCNSRSSPVQRCADTQSRGWYFCHSKLPSPGAGSKALLWHMRCTGMAEADTRLAEASLRGAGSWAESSWIPTMTAEPRSLAADSKTWTTQLFWGFVPHCFFFWPQVWGKQAAESKFHLVFVSQQPHRTELRCWTPFVC